MMVGTAGSQHQTDILVVGAGLGGIAAALAALRRGRRVTLTEPTDWIGGQLTTQGVPPDEHRWVEQCGRTASYQQLRTAIRDAYRRDYPLTPMARADAVLNPGQGTVGPICHEPVVAHRVLKELLVPYLASGRLRLQVEWTPVRADVEGDRVRAVAFRDCRGDEHVVGAPFVLDATELGDLLPLAGIEHVTGAESQADTGEPHAPRVGDPLNMQAFSVCFALEHRPGEDHTIERPAGYDHWRTVRPPGWPGRLLGFVGPNPQTLEPRLYGLDPEGDGAAAAAGAYDLWAYRRILSRRQLLPGARASDITLVNWPMNDYLEGPLIGVDAATASKHLDRARELSLSLLYWLQTEAPRPDGGSGWPGLRLTGAPLGTADGVAKAPYIRESRRIRALTTVVEQDVSFAERGRHGARQYRDSVGIGAYRIDLHPSTGGDQYIDIASVPFQIPLGALLPQRVRNVLAAGKDIGTTHITNGCYRLHPVEWNIGEAAGALAAHCQSSGTEPHAVQEDAARLGRFQDELVRDGVELSWPDDIRTGSGGDADAP